MFSFKKRTSIQSNKRPVVYVAPKKSIPKPTNLDKSSQKESEANIIKKINDIKQSRRTNIELLSDTRKELDTYNKYKKVYKIIHK